MRTFIKMGIISLLYMKNVIKRAILEKLIHMGKWGGAHTDIRNISRLPISIKKKDYDKAVKELINDRWLLAKKSTGSIHVSLNSHYKKEILEFINK